MGRAANESNSPAQGSVLVSVRDLTIDYSQNRRWVTAVRGVSFDVARGDSYGIVGESGCGKSTTLRTLIGFRHPGSRITSGRVLFDGRDLLARSASDLRRIRGRRIAYVPQNPATSLTPTMRIGKQIIEPLIAHRICPTYKQAQARMFELLERVRIPEPELSAKKYPHQLSGGQQQRVVIAMALAARAELLLLDEPTTGLDVTTQGRILELLRDLRSQSGLTLVYVTHNLAVIANICDKVGVMYAGELVEEGPTREIFRQPRHPYTRGLMASVPSLHAAATRRFAPLRGMLIRDQLPVGCKFAPRCDYAQPTCSSERQKLVRIEPDRNVACWRWEDAALKPQPALFQTGEQARGASAQEGQASEARPAKLSVRNLDVAYRFERGRWWLNRGVPITVVRDVAFEIRPGETLGLVGESGSGKSTIAKALAGLQPPVRGDLKLDGQEIGRSTRTRPRSTLRRIQLVLQNPDASLNPRQRVVDIVGRPLQVFFGMRKSEVRTKVEQLLQDVRLDHTYLDRFPNQLSGGERQRVAIARALAAEPETLLCDEVVSALDVSVQAEILDLLRVIQAERNVSYLFIAHDLAVVRSLAHRVAVLFNGELMEIGPTREVYAAPNHPYTHVLLSAVPDVDPDKKSEPVRGSAELVRMKGKQPACAFAHSCPWKIGAICEDTPPPRRQISNGRYLRCHIPVDELQERERALHEVLNRPSGDDQTASAAEAVADRGSVVT